MDRELLWMKLGKLGLEEGSINIIRGLYKNHKRKIRIGRGTTDWIPCDRGLRKGCPMAQLLFTLLIADVPEKLKMTGRGVKIQEVRMSSMMYADDIVILLENELDMAILLSTLIR